MIFRPKIFISSTFKENEQIRQDIEEYLYSVGAEPLLYENELTPSVIPMTYRTNLLDADFMILIVKKNYGTLTELGISGIHEEYKIAYNNKIPIHVYLKKSEKKKNSNPLVDDLKKDGISYYYFNDDTDLLKRIKETTFTIAKEIMLSQITNNKLPRNSIIKLAGNLDYNRAMEIISIIETMKNIAKLNELDYIYTDIFFRCLEMINYEFCSLRHSFINWEIDNLLNNILKISNTFIEHSEIDFTTIHGTSKEYNISLLGKVQVSHLSHFKCSDWSISNYNDCLKNFFESYNTFKTLIQNIKTEIDII